MAATDLNQVQGIVNNQQGEMIDIDLGLLSQILVDNKFKEEVKGFW